MSKDEIQLALRHIAIGRVNTEAVMAFAEKMELVFDRVLGTAPPVEVPGIPDGSVSPSETPLTEAAKRTRKPKAD